MPRKAGISEVLQTLAVLGPSAAPALCRQLGVSQATLSRLLRQASRQVLVTGRARATRYAARRDLRGVELPVPVYEVDGRGALLPLCRLHPCEPRGWYVEGLHESCSSRHYADLPWFLYDLRPAGFLGRLLPARHPELRLPADIRDWSAEHCLRYWTVYGWDQPGDLILGEAAAERFLSQPARVARAVSVSDRERLFMELAADVLRATPPGSSAGGEQPKFLTTVGNDVAIATEVLVKFTSATADPAAQRWADLLTAEQLASRILTHAGLPAARSSLLRAGQQVFLEVERFDRLPGGGRRGLVSLAALDHEYVGQLHSWGETALALERLGLISAQKRGQIEALELFGHLIGNSDMHHGNLSFIAEHATQLCELAPVYDMLPMAYAPRGGAPPEAPLPPLVPPRLAARLDQVRPVARSYWQELAEVEHLSPEMRAIAAFEARRLA